MGVHIRGNVDFTSAITPMLKALELELGKYLYTGYVNFLEKNNVSVAEFNSERCFIKRSGYYRFSLTDPEDLKNFTLGSLPLLVGLESGKLDYSSDGSGESRTRKKKVKAAPIGVNKPTIDRTMLEYLKVLFKEDVFEDFDRDNAIVTYIVNLTQTVSDIAKSFRNPAAHSAVMSYTKAEACANSLIKAKKIIRRFLEKIKISEA
jgi:hypothetical protein